MLILWFVLFITATTQCHKVVESTEDIDPPMINVTTLYPVSNKKIFSKNVATNNDVNQYMKEKYTSMNESENQGLNEKGDVMTSMNIQNKNEIIDGDEIKEDNLNDETFFRNESNNNQPVEGKYTARDVIEHEYLEQKNVSSEKRATVKDYVNSDNKHVKENYILNNENNHQSDIETSIVEDKTVKLNSKGSTKTHVTGWKLETSFAESNSNAQEHNCNFSYSKDKEAEPEKETNYESKPEFKPSQPLGSFFDEVSISDDTFETFTPIQTPTSDIVIFPTDKYRRTFGNIPSEIYETYTEFPYKFENTGNLRASNNWNRPDSLQTRPTAAVPVKVPAGGLYKLTDPFREKPVAYGDYEDFGLEFNGGVKENHIKQRVNPWQNLVRLMTAFIPVGLIISALTPSVITVHSGVDSHRPVNPYRRSDTGTSIADIPPISERCRRRLLCELHSDQNYQLQSRHRLRGKYCYKIQCGDAHAMQRVLRWLLTYHPGAGDHSGRHIT